MMNANKIMYNISDIRYGDRTLRDNFDIDLNAFDGSNDALLVANKDGYFAYLGVKIRIEFDHENEIFVDFLNRHQEGMQVIYAFDSFNMYRFVRWFKDRLSDFIYQSIVK